MSCWQAIALQNGDKHVVPVTRQGRVLNKHELRRDCYCAPRPDPEDTDVWVHADKECGGGHGEDLH
jgi:hypothetical protein